MLSMHHNGHRKAAEEDGDQGTSGRGMEKEIWTASFWINYCVKKNKLCNIFVVNDTKELSEIRQSWLYNSVIVISCWTEIFLHNNYYNIDAISRHLATAGLLCVYVFFIFSLSCVHICMLRIISTVWSVNKDYGFRHNWRKTKAAILDSTAWRQDLLSGLIIKFLRLHSVPFTTTI